MNNINSMLEKTEGRTRIIIEKIKREQPKIQELNTKDMNSLIDQEYYRSIISAKDQELEQKENTIKNMRNTRELMVKEYRRMRQEFEEVKSQNISQKRDIETMQKTISSLHDQNESLKKENFKLNIRNKVLSSDQPEQKQPEQKQPKEKREKKTARSKKSLFETYLVKNQEKPEFGSFSSDSDPFEISFDSALFHLYFEESLKGSLSNKSPLPILHGIHISALKGDSEDIIRLQSTDLETGTEVFMKGEVKAPGSIVIPVYAVKAFPKEGIITLKVIDSGKFELINHGSNEIQAFTYFTSSEFPMILDISQSTFKITIETREFQKRLKAVLHSVAGEEETRGILKNVLLTSGNFNNELILISTDGRRLSKAVVPIRRTGEKPFSMAVSPQFIKGILKYTPAWNNDYMDLYVFKNHIQADFNYSSRILGNIKEGNFPHYNHVIPEDTSTWYRFHIDPKYLSETVKKAYKITENSAKEKHVIRLKFKTNKVLISSSVPDSGSFFAELDLHMARAEREPSGFYLDLAINGKYLDQAVQDSVNTLCLCVKDPESPIYIYADNSEELVMPIRIREEEY